MEDLIAPLTTLLVQVFGCSPQTASAIVGVLVMLVPIAVREWRAHVALRDAKIGAAIRIVEERKRPGIALAPQLSKVAAEDEAMRMGVRMKREHLGDHIERIGPKVVDGFGRRSKAPDAPRVQVRPPKLPTKGKPS